MDKQKLKERHELKKASIDNQKKEAIEWATGEATLWISNDETLYLKALKCRTATALKAMYGNCGPKRMFNTRYCDWNQVFIDTRE